MLSVLHVDPERGWGGGQAQLVALCQHLAQRGHRQIVACRADGALRPHLRANGIEVCDLSIRNDLDLRGAWQLRRVLRGHEFDVVHFHTARAHAMTPWLARGRSRFLVTRHMDYPPRFRPRVRYLYNRCVDGVIAVSNAIAGILVAAGVDRGRVRVIHVGIDCDRFTDCAGQREAVRRIWGAGQSDLVVFSAAVLEPRKGHDVLLEALTHLVAEGVPVHWVVCGDGSLRAHLEEQVRTRGLAGRVTFTGFSPDVPHLLAGADVCVMPSRREGLGIAAMEGMAARLPVVASRVGGLPEIVAEEETGLLVAPEDAAGLADAVRRLHGDRQWARELGERGRSRVLEQFTSAEMAAKVEAYYYDLVGEQGERK